VATNKLTPARYIGKVCVKHPSFGGVRARVSGVCVQCQSDYGSERRRHRKEIDPEYKKKSNTRARENLKSSPSGREYRRCRAKQRKFLRMSRVPLWADLSAIRKIYESAQKQGLTVDHIIPLRGELVCGLHVENNLQLLDRDDNIAKGNKYVP